MCVLAVMRVCGGGRPQRNVMSVYSTPGNRLWRSELYRQPTSGSKSAPECLNAGSGEVNYLNAVLVVGQRGPVVARGNGFWLKPAQVFWSLSFSDAGVKIKVSFVIFQSCFGWNELCKVPACHCKHNNKRVCVSAPDIYDCSCMCTHTAVARAERHKCAKNSVGNVAPTSQRCLETHLQGKWWHIIYSVWS